jgi:hypothetical protein
MTHYQFSIHAQPLVAALAQYMRDLDHTNDLALFVDLLEVANEVQIAMTLAARHLNQKHTWAEIGNACGMSAQAAHKRWAYSPSRL